MPRGDFYGGPPGALERRPATRPATPSGTASRSSVGEGSVRRPGGAAPSHLTHCDTGVPLGYAHAFEARITYVKDRWCSPACDCLHQAIAAGNIRLMDAAVEGATPYTRAHGIDQRDEHYRTPIMVAAIRGFAEICEKLADTGASLSTQDKDGRTALHLAAMCKDPASVLKGLCRNNIDATAVDVLGDSCLHKVVKVNCVEGARLLCTAYPRLSLVKDRKGKRPYDLAKTAKMRAEVGFEAAARAVQLENEILFARAAEMEATQQLTEKQLKMQQTYLDENMAMPLSPGHQKGKKVSAKAANLSDSDMSEEAPDDWAVFDPTQAVKLEKESLQRAERQVNHPEGGGEDESKIRISFFTKQVTTSYVAPKSSEEFEQAPSGSATLSRHKTVGNHMLARKNSTASGRPPINAAGKNLG